MHYGDASRLDLLRAAGAEHAKIFVLAISDLDQSMRIAEAITKHFPHLKIIARARNRRHAHKLMDLGVEHIFRETLLSSVAMTELVLRDLGYSDKAAKRLIERIENKIDDPLMMMVTPQLIEGEMLTPSR